MQPPALMNFGGDWQSYSETIYQRYHTDIVEKPRSLWGNEVKIRWKPVEQEKPFNFWHVISEGQTEESRTPDMSRCARIGWIAWVINSCNENHECIRWYISERSTPRGRKFNLVLWAHEHDYVVILEPRDGFALLVTAYPLAERRRQKVAREYADFVKKPSPIPYWDAQKTEAP